MKIRSIHHVLFSPCGGTGKATKALGRDLALQTCEHDLTLPANRSGELSFTSEDLVFFGFPVYAGRIPKNAAQVLAGVTGHDTPCVLVAVYGNRAFEGALLDLHAAVVPKGFKPVAAVAAIAEHSLSPQTAANRPDTADHDVLAGFGRQILERAESGEALGKAPGAYPERKAPPPAGLYFFPVTDNNACTQCGACARVCPTGAAPQNDPGRTDTAICIACAACIKYCPQQARIFGTPETRKMLAHILANATARKESELFL